jgi:hypothetical protein
MTAPYVVATTATVQTTATATGATVAAADILLYLIEKG